MRGKRTTQTVLALPPPRIAARFRTCSFFSVFILLSSVFPPFLYSPPRPFFFREAVVNSSSRTNFGGDARRCDRRGMAAILFASATRLHCVTSSFIPDFAVDLRSEFTKTVTPIQCAFSFFFFVRVARPLLFYRWPRSLRNHHCPLTVSRKHSALLWESSRDDYVIQCHATSFFTTLWWNIC